MNEEIRTETGEVEDPKRRTFLKYMTIAAFAAASAGALRATIQNIIPKSAGITGFPQLLLVDSATGKAITTPDLKVNNSAIVTFDYPLQGEPNFLLRLGDSSGSDVKVSSVSVKIPASGKTFQSPGGVGPYESVVASSAICQHLGCIPPIIHFYKPGTSIPNGPSGSQNTNGLIHCNCHGSTYDPLKGFGIVTGPTQNPLPNVSLKYDKSKDQYYTLSMVGPTIYGHSSDLSGGNPLSSNTQAEVTTQSS